MSSHIMVIDPLPLLRRGILAVLYESGLEGDAAEEPEDLLGWVEGEQRRLLILSITHADDWATLETVCRSDRDLRVLVLLQEADRASCLRALHVGAISVMPRDTVPSVLREAVMAALGGRAVVPVEVLQTLAAAAPATETGLTGPSAQEIAWLRELAAGVTVSELATRVGYSERMMFRLLRDVYTKIGAGNRTQALLRARDAGLLS